MLPHAPVIKTVLGSSSIKPGKQLVLELFVVLIILVILVVFVIVVIVIIVIVVEVQIVEVVFTTDRARLVRIVDR